MPAYDGVVLAGGSGRRLGGADKAMLDVGGRPAIERVLTALSGAATVAVVGPRRPVRAGTRAVSWCREEPPGGGPAAALGAGLRAGHADVVVVLGVDHALVDAATVRRLVAALAGGTADGAVLVDAAGHDQPLVAAYRRVALTGRCSGGALRAALAGLRLARLDDTGGVALDCDTWADVAEVRRRAAGGRTPGGAPEMLQDWTAALARELGVEDPVDVRLLLDLSRDAAHSVVRPAAPVTTFLVGYAAGLRGGGPDAVRAAAETAARLAREWPAASTDG